MSGEVYLGGHSMGGAEVYEYAYSRLIRGLRVDGIYALAPAQPGDSVLAAALARVPVIVPLKNRRDIVPSLPIDIAFLDEEYIQPRPLVEINEMPTSGGIFADHAVSLYLTGALKLPPIGVSVEIGPAAEQIARLYCDATGWDWINAVDGRYWAMKVMPSGAKLMIRRGTETPLDFLDDFDATMISVLGARMSKGFWAGIQPIEGALDLALA